MRCLPRLSPTLPLLVACHSFKDLPGEIIPEQSLKTSVKESKYGGKKAKKPWWQWNYSATRRQHSHRGSFLKLSTLEMTTTLAQRPVHLLQVMWRKQGWWGTLRPGECRSSQGLKAELSPDPLPYERESLPLAFHTCCQQGTWGHSLCASPPISGKANIK